MDETLDKLEDGDTSSIELQQSERNEFSLGIAEDTPIDDWNLKRIQDLENELKELQPLLKENQRLRRCVRGVKVVGRALQEAQKEVEVLRGVVKEDNGCGASMHPGGIIVDDVEASTQEMSFSMPQIIVPPKDDVKSSGETTPTGARLGEPWVIYPDIGNLAGETHDQFASSGRKTHLVDSEGKLAIEISKWSEGSTQIQTTTAAEHHTEDVAAGGDLIGQKYFPSVKTTPRDDIAPGAVMKSVGTVTDGGDICLERTLALHETTDLQMQLNELKKVNLDWEKFCKQQKSAWVAQVEDKNKTIIELRKELEDARPNTERKAKEYDQMLLTAKTRIDKAEERNKELQSQLDTERSQNDKSNQLSRNLAKQNQSMADEIMRLKEALERKHQQTVRQSQSSPVVQPVIKPQQSGKGVSSPNIEANQKAPRDLPASAASFALAPLPPAPPADEMAATTRPKHGLPAPAPYTPDPRRDVPVSAQTAAVDKQDEGIADKSYSKEELNEQLELLRQQNMMFHSDFRKENADKIQAIEKLHNLQRELDTNKGRLKGRGHRDQTREAATWKFDNIVKSPTVRGPKQQMYEPPSDYRTKSHKAHRKSEQKPPAQTCNEVTVLQMGGETTCKLAQPTTVIIHTEPEGQRLKINLLEMGSSKQKADKIRQKMEPFVCPRCQRLYKGDEWESYEHHVTLCNVR